MGLAPSAFPCREMDGIFHGPQLHAFQILGRADGTLVVSDVAEAVFPVAEIDDTLLLHGLVQGLAKFAVKGGPQALSRVGKLKGRRE